MTGARAEVRTGEDLLDLSPVLPVVVVEEARDAVPLARALLRGGVRVVEVTLRTAAGLEAIRRIAGEVEDVVVGAGTILTGRDVDAAAAAGARFLVSPGSPAALVEALAGSGLPSLPGAATVSEMMALADRGWTALKFFPAAAAGGPAYLAAVHGPLPALRFCPTGGIDATSAPGYLALPYVGCVGGSWLTPRDAVATGDWDRVTSLARDAETLRRSVTSSDRHRSER